jgi:hypothetical protein
VLRPSCVRGFLEAPTAALEHLLRLPIVYWQECGRGIVCLALELGHDRPVIRICSKRWADWQSIMSCSDRRCWPDLRLCCLASRYGLPSREPSMHPASPKHSTRPSTDVPARHNRAHASAAQPSPAGRDSTRSFLNASTLREWPLRSGIVNSAPNPHRLRTLRKPRAFCPRRMATPVFSDQGWYAVTSQSSHFSDLVAMYQAKCDLITKR